MKARVLFAVLTLGFVSTAHALIVAGPDGTINTTAPANGAPWSHVGILGGATGVYIGAYGGGYWVLTATHVGLGNITLNNVSYTAVSGSGLPIGGGDLFAYRISGDPGLSNLALSSVTPATGSNVTMVGYGLNRAVSPLTGEGLAGWNVTGSGNDRTWTEIATGTANAAGYYQAGSHTMRWGTNTIDGVAIFNIGTGATTGLYTTFSAITGEAQGSGGDSGGAMFFLNGSTWELAGILGAVATFEDQPGSTAIFGNLTYAASIATYHGAIVSAIPEPADVALGFGAVAAAVVCWRRRRSRAEI